MRPVAGSTISSFLWSLKTTVFGFSCSGATWASEETSEIFASCACDDATANAVRTIMHAIRVMWLLLISTESELVVGINASLPLRGILVPGLRDLPPAEQRTEEAKRVER